MTEALMQKFFVFEQAGPYMWQPSERTSGPFWDVEEVFDSRGYASHEEALRAIKSHSESDQYTHGIFFIMPGYSK